MDLWKCHRSLREKLRLRVVEERDRDRVIDVVQALPLSDKKGIGSLSENRIRRPPEERGTSIPDI